MTDQPAAYGIARTLSASKYLQQLCKHWSHKAETQFDAAEGSVRFDSGEEVFLAAKPDALHVTARVKVGDDLDAWKKVIAEHLIRFAFREELDVDWTGKDLP
ncbi:DUF2218 domain-containing protein [Ruegeria lacuscaerulensis]|uniref:DUF2218 domain-containing protein n=1 Tax=Ruegeria lacuscaerulensis TaxID=55218 RepID=UPI00147DBB90|nr:DUF2218 domain-containing protein [Ruegeria lacuscaerulensis]